jgi:transcriptional regulator with XRE-family HTH domain
MISKYKKNNPAISARMDYGFARARDLAFDAVNELSRKRQANGMKQAELALRLGRDTGWLSKKLKGPGNWTLRTFGEMAEALGGEIEISIHPLEEPTKKA